MSRHQPAAHGEANATKLVFEQVQVQAQGGPAKRGFSASGIDEVTGTLYVFGGLTTPGFTALADGWTLKLTEE